VFYRKGLFGDAIILDQTWALDAVYSVFDRDSRCFKSIERHRGRFTRSDLGDWVWQKHGVEEQELFLSFMQQCGICFVFRKGDQKKGIEAEYIAPDMLPGRDDPETTLQLRQKWDNRSDAEATLGYDLLPPGLMRSLISKIGHEAGLAAEYWRDGVYFYDGETGSRALVQQRRTAGWSGEIYIQTQRGQAEALLGRLLKFIDERHDVIGARPAGRRQTARKPDGNPHQEGEGPLPIIKPGHEPSPEPEWYISYAWGDDTEVGREREAVVDRFCVEAAARGVEIIRDKTAMSPGDRISKFMARLGRGNRVFIILSDKYLRSPYCMSELFDVWRNCREDDKEFIARTRVFVLPCARIRTPAMRAEYASYWLKTYDERRKDVKKYGQLSFSDEDNADYRRMSRFVNETANILKLVQDVLKPQDFDAFIEYGLGDKPKL
jgi:internalin A